MNLISFVLLFIFSTTSFAKVSPLTETISVNVKIEGDLNAEYALNGALGSVLSSDGTPCGLSGLFRKVIYRHKNSIEAWLTLECTQEGQKNTYKLKRIFLDVTANEQNIVLAALAKNLRKMNLKFQDLTLKKGK